MKSLIAMVAALSLAAGATANAQQFSDTSYGARDIRVGVGITVPLGGARQSRTPHIELSILPDRIAADGARLSATIARPPSMRLAWSLEQHGRLTLNGQQLNGPRDTRHGVSTLGAVAIGAAVGLVAIGGLFFSN